MASVQSAMPPLHIFESQEEVAREQQLRRQTAAKRGGPRGGGGLRTRGPAKTAMEPAAAGPARGRTLGDLDKNATSLAGDAAPAGPTKAPKRTKALQSQRLEQRGRLRHVAAPQGAAPSAGGSAQRLLPGAAKRNQQILEIRCDGPD
eukprot:SAG31_NODE_2254_length_6073_cov_3.048711_7_plen_147_part_00